MIACGPLLWIAPTPSRAHEASRALRSLTVRPLSCPPHNWTTSGAASLRRFACLDAASARARPPSPADEATSGD